MSLFRHFVQDALADVEFLAAQHGAAEEDHLGLGIVLAHLGEEALVALL